LEGEIPREVGRASRGMGGAETGRREGNMGGLILLNWIV